MKNYFNNRTLNTISNHQNDQIIEILKYYDIFVIKIKIKHVKFNIIICILRVFKLRCFDCENKHTFF